MPGVRATSTAEPIVLQWHSGSASGVLFDADLNLHSGTELLRWAATGIKFVVIDRDTGDDVTRLFLAHGADGQVVDPVGRIR